MSLDLTPFITLYNERPIIEELDFFPHDRIIKTIETIIQSNTTNQLKKKVLLLDGVWGSGKTSILDKLSSLQVNNESKYSRIFLDAWNASYSILLKEFARGLCREVFPEQNIEIFRLIDTNNKDISTAEFNGGVGLNTPIIKIGANTSSITKIEYTPQGDFTPHTFKKILKQIKFGSKPVLIMIDNMDRLDDVHVVSYQDAVYTLISECEELEHEVWFILACDVSQFKNKQRAYFDRISAITVTVPSLNEEMARRFFIRQTGINLVDMENLYRFNIYNQFRQKAESLQNIKIYHTPRLIKRVFNQLNIQEKIARNNYGNFSSAALIVACAEVLGLTSFLLENNFCFQNSPIEKSQNILVIPTAEGDTIESQNELRIKITSLVYKEPAPTKREWLSFLHELTYLKDDKTMVNKIRKKIILFASNESCRVVFTTVLIELAKKRDKFYDDICRYFKMFIDINTELLYTVNRALAEHYVKVNNVDMLVNLSRIYEFRKDLIGLFLDGAFDDIKNVKELINSYLDKLVKEESMIPDCEVIITPSEFNALNNAEKDKAYNYFNTAMLKTSYEPERPDYIFTARYIELIIILEVDFKEKPSTHKNTLFVWLKRYRNNKFDSTAINEINNKLSNDYKKIVNTWHGRLYGSGHPSTLLKTTEN